MHDLLSERWYQKHADYIVLQNAHEKNTVLDSISKELHAN